MDRNTITGLVLVGILLMGYMWFNSSKIEKFNKEKAIKDSIAMVDEVRAAKLAVERQREQAEARGEEFDEAMIAANGVVGAEIEADKDSIAYFGNELHEAKHGAESLYVVENDVMKVRFSNHGGRIDNVELKGYKKYNGDPLMLAAEGSTGFNLSYFIQRDFHNTQINTSDYYFTTDAETTTTVVGDKQVVSMKLHMDSDSYMEYLYVIAKDDYMIDFNVRFVSMGKILPNQSDITFTWDLVAPRQEKGFENENNFSNIAYKFPGESSIDDIGRSKQMKEEDIRSRVQWIAFKQQFFSSVFIADNSFQDAFMRYDTYDPSSPNFKKYHASMAVPFTNTTTEYGFKFYFGPNKYSQLKQYDGLYLQKLVPLGWGIFGWINQYGVIPIFNFLSGRIASFGIIILILTILLRLIVFPFTYKSYLSGAKMRLLKPEMDAINEKYPKKEDALKKQQEVMALNKRAGVNPLGGCLPAFIQMPFFIALFRFFPASIELRGESFLWSNDLSAYDSILDLPFDVPMYGDHISLFTLLMAVMMYLSARINMTQQPTQDAPGMGGMKYMMLYLMPIMMLLWFNNYASGLTYYYCLSTAFGVLQMLAFRYMVSDEKLHAKMQENAKKVAKQPKKQSKWGKRYSEMLKQQSELQERQKKGKK